MRCFANSFKEQIMNMVHVNSSAISAVGYDEQTRQMRIQFTSGRTYDFCGVPVSVYMGLMAASSKGQYYNSFIRDLYTC